MSDTDCLFMVKDAGISSDKHALIIPPFMSRGKRVHPMPISDSSMSCKLVDLNSFDICELCAMLDVYSCSD